MLNPHMNEFAVFICLAVITGAPFYFKNWLDRTRPVLADTVHRKTSFLSGLIFFALFTGAFAFKGNTPRVGGGLLFAAIVSFSILYQFAGRYSHSMNRIRPESLVSHKASLRQTAGRFVMGLLLFASIAKVNLLILVLPFIIPFVTPVYLRIQHKATRMADSTLRAGILNTFRTEGVPLSNVFILDDPNSTQKNALITGSGFGIGPFGRTLFITLSLFESLNEEELRAVILHEAAHLKSNHVLKRILATVFLMIGSAYWVVVPTAFVLPGNIPAILGAMALALLVHAWLLSRVITKQEHEADLAAVSMGASSNALVSALEKVSEGRKEIQTPVLRLINGNLYPTVAARIQAIRACGAPESTRVFTQPSRVLAYSLMVMGVVLWSANGRYHTANVSHSERTIAGR